MQKIFYHCFIRYASPLLFVQSFLSYFVNIGGLFQSLCLSQHVIDSDIRVNQPRTCLLWGEECKNGRFWANKYLNPLSFCKFSHLEVHCETHNQKKEMWVLVLYLDYISHLYIRWKMLDPSMISARELAKSQGVQLFASLYLIELLLTSFCVRTVLVNCF